MRTERRKAFTLVELLVVIAVIGILIGMLLPAVQQIRETARRAACMNKLRQIGLATHMFHDSFGAFPPSRISSPLDTPASKQTEGSASWFVMLLPFVEQNDVFELWDFSKDYASQTSEAVSTPIEMFLCSSRHTTGNAYAPDSKIVNRAGGWGWGTTSIIVVGGAVGDYAGNHGDTSPGSTGAATDFYRPGNGTGVIITSRGILDGNRDLTSDWLDKISFGSIGDGSSNTFLAGEMHIPNGELNTAPYNGPVFNGPELVSHSRIGGPGAPILSERDDPGDLFGFGSAHPSGCNFVNADGSTHFKSNALDTIVLANLCHRRDGNVSNND